MLKFCAVMLLSADLDLPRELLDKSCCRNDFRDIFI